LLYDNSASPLQDRESLPTWVDYVHNPDNGGTAAAYREAARRARLHGCTWALLLDQDTQLPDDFLDTMSMSVVNDRDSCVGMLVPYIRQEREPLSPSTITLWGQIRALRPGADVRSIQRLTAIASGALVRTQVLDELDDLPHAVWLDYVDHWLCARLARSQWKVVVAPAVLEHELSVTTVRRMEPHRLRSILEGEMAFVASQPLAARLAHPVRLAARGARYLAAGHRSASLIFRYVPRAVRGIFQH
jgi:GT2 family glycosyltransferase